jgi:hypothetical protein
MILMLMHLFSGNKLVIYVFVAFVFERNPQIRIPRLWTVANRITKFHFANPAET